jgi:hypothetical protein
MIKMDAPASVPCDMTHSPNTMVPIPSNRSMDHLYLQQSIPFWTGGHLVSPYEQKTQQSPLSGLSNSPQPAHS